MTDQSVPEFFLPAAENEEQAERVYATVAGSSVNNSVPHSLKKDLAARLCP